MPSSSHKEELKLVEQLSKIDIRNDELSTPPTSISYKEGLKLAGRLSKIDIRNDVCMGRTTGVEENIKNKIVIPMLEALGWKVGDMDFEHLVRKGRADLALCAWSISSPDIFTEVKSIEKILNQEKIQALEYAIQKRVKWVIISNGALTQLYCSSIENVEPRSNMPILEFYLKDFANRFDIIWRYLSKENFKNIDRETGERVEYIKNIITEQEFLKEFKEFKDKLFIFLRWQFVERYGNDNEFTSKIKKWTTTSKIDIRWTWKQQFNEDRDFKAYIQAILESEGIDNTLKSLDNRYDQDAEYRTQVIQALKKHDIPVDWYDRICAQGAYSFINRLLFLRIYEDRVLHNQHISKGALQLIEGDNIPPECVLDSLRAMFSKMSQHFKTLYASPLFDSILLEDIIWNDSKLICKMIEHTHTHDFSKVDRNVLGKVYRGHIPKQVKKALGMFDTSPEIASYMLGRFNDDIRIGSKFMELAPGSGTFLIEEYNRLRDVYGKKEIYGEYAHREIVKRCLYGVELDPFATQLSIMNLLLQDLEHPVDITNVICGNSLDDSLNRWVPSESKDIAILEGEREISESVDEIFKRFQSDEDGNEENKFIIGNPPHGFVARNDIRYRQAMKYDFAPVIDRKANIAALFLKRAVDLLLPSGGKIAFILPKTFTFSTGYSNLRSFIRKSCRIIEITDLGRAWNEVGAEQIILFLELHNTKNQREDDAQVRIVSGMARTDFLKFDQYDIHHVSEQDLMHGPGFSMYWKNPQFKGMDRVWKKMWEGATELRNVSDIFRGIPRKKIQTAISSKRKTPMFTPILRGSNIGPSRDVTRWILNGRYEWIDTAHKHLSINKIKQFRKVKILAKRQVSSDVKIDAIVDESALKNDLPFYNIDTIVNIVPHEGVDPYFLLGILHSHLVTAYLRDVIFNRATLTMQLDREYIGRIPIIENPGDGEEEIAKLAKEITNSHKKLSGIGRGIERADENIPIIHSLSEKKNRLNKIVYKLYGVEKYSDILKTLATRKAS